MAVKLYFGLPGCGKTTLLAAMALKGSRCRRYKYVYSNVGIAVPGVTLIDNVCVGKYNLSDCLILIDEGTLFADSRHHKEFPKEVCEYFMLHRHYNSDIVIFTQGWDTLDKRIRQITDRVYYVYKTPILGHWWTRYYRIPYGIIIPDPKKDSGSTKLGEIIQGYCKPNFMVRLFSHRLFRPKYYRYFDSWETKELPPLPDTYQPYQRLEDTMKRPTGSRYLIIKKLKKTVQDSICRLDTPEAADQLEAEINRGRKGAIFSEVEAKEMIDAINEVRKAQGWIFE